MSNKGLKKHIKQLTNKIGNVCLAHVNPYKNDSNLILEMPLLETKGLDPFNVSLIFNYLNRDEENNFKKGMKLNFFSALRQSGSNYIIEESDGTKYTYQLEVENEETKQTLSRTETNTYVLKDKYGNKSVYTSIT